MNYLLHFTPKYFTQQACQGSTFWLHSKYFHIVSYHTSTVTQHSTQSSYLKDSIIFTFHTSNPSRSTLLNQYHQSLI